MIKGYAAIEPGKPLQPFEYDPGALKPDEVEVEVTHCGICHSDLSMIDNEWQMSSYPFIPGHEIVGRVAAVGAQVQNLGVGQTVGVGWFSRSCATCRTCLAGDHNLCAQHEGVIVGRHGGFAEKVRCHALWATPLPAGVTPADAGPLFCGGITVFNPIVQYGVQPTDRVGVVGIGGLGHLAVKFHKAWGCEVTAFTSNPAKIEEARGFGAHHVISSKDDVMLEKIAGTLDFVLVTVNVPLKWELFIKALGPRGHLHFVGAVLEPIPTQVFSLLTGQKSIAATPLGSPATVAKMLDFCARHEIAPMTEHFPLKDVNAALDHLRAGRARYRIVLDVKGG